MIWGCMSSAGVGILFICSGRINSQTYITMLEQILESKIFEEKIWQMMRKYSNMASMAKIFEEKREQVIFQQDNAPCHIARKNIAWFEQNRIKLLECPPQSPDLNPIVHLWDHVKKNIHARVSAIRLLSSRKWLSKNKRRYHPLYASN